MLRILKKSWWVILLAASMQNASPFAMLGVREPYQTDALGYEPPYWGQPKNIGEGFRWTIPKLYYTFDSTFLDYFGSNGVWSVDQAVQIMNAIPPVSTITNLDEYPLEATGVNYTAQALHLMDIKTMALWFFVERLGLADPTEFTWTLRNRWLPPGAQCPFYVYNIIQRNFDPDTLLPTSYVNGNLMTYYIWEQCPTPNSAEAIELLVDPTQNRYSAVASGWGERRYDDLGFYFTGLTRDDLGGLRYLYRPGTMFVSAAGEDTYTFNTNASTAQLLISSNANLFAAQALTNTAAGLQAIYPNLIVLNTTNTFTNVWITNLTAYYTNYPLDPVGTPPRLMFATNYTLTVQPTYQHMFANLYTMSNYQGSWLPVPLPTIHNWISRQFVTIQTTSVTNSPYAPYGTVVTNTTTKTYGTNIVGGEVFILPTNACSLNVVALQATITNRWTNLLISATNTVAADTNNIGSTNVMFFTQEMITYSTNRAFIINPVTCDTNSVALRQGIDKVSFVRRDYDSLLNRFFYPITNTYYLNIITNWTLQTQTVRRIVTRPDIVFAAADITDPPGDIVNWVAEKSDPFFVRAGTNNTPFPVYGPGTIEGPAFMTFGKVGPLWTTIGGNYVPREEDASFTYRWGSFDGSTNLPVVYPIGTSLDALTNQVFMYVANDALPDAQVGQPYSVQLLPGGSSAVGKTFKWKKPDNTPDMPWGIQLSEDGWLTAFDPSALQPNIYDFVVRMEDATEPLRFVDRAFTLTILPQ